MQSIYEKFDHWLPGVSGIAVFWAIVALAVLVLGSFGLVRRRRLRAESSNKSIARQIRKLSVEALSHVMINDGIEGNVYIDYLCLNAAGIAVVDIKDYRGLLFGGTNTDQWTQVVDHRSFRFDNPLYQNRDRVRALEALVDDVPVFGCVVFTNAGTFPKDRPDGIYLQEHLADALRAGVKKGEVPEKFKDAWQKLKVILVPTTRQSI